VSAPFGAGHSRLFGSHAGGLASTWQRAALAEAHAAAPADGARRANLRRRGAGRRAAVQAVSAVAVLAACLLPWLLMTHEPVAEAGVAAPVVAVGAAVGV
jgi:hypothetical protein